ncbi:MAG TPA: hypothetical protein VJJ24_03225 [Candidatus Paceibacterota bacterium]
MRLKTYKKILGLLLAVLIILGSTPNSALAFANLIFAGQAGAGGGAAGGSSGGSGACGGQTGGAAGAGAGAGGATAGGGAAAAATGVFVPVVAPATDAQLAAILTTNTTLTASEVADNTSWCFKEFILDVLFYLLNNVIIERITADVVTWINSGFEGKPAFVQDQKALYQELEGTVIGSFLNEFDLGYLCSPFADKLKRSFQIQLALQKSGGRNGREAQFRAGSQCTLDRVASTLGTTYEEFSNDFSRGGWDMFLHIAQPQNNEYGAYLILRDELSARTQEEKDRTAQKLDWGRGFLSWTKKGECISGISTVSEDGNSGTDTCTEYAPDQIMTPGSVIESQLNNTLGSGQRRIEMADEINEVIGALLSQLVNQVLGPNGLFGSSQSSGGGGSYIDQVRTSSENQDAFNITFQAQLATAEKVLNGYITITEQTKTRTMQSKQLLESLEACSPGSATQPLSQINTTLTEIDRTLTEARQILAGVDKLQGDTSTLSFDRYQSLTQELKDVEIIFNNDQARTEQEMLFVDLDKLDTETRSRLQQCPGTTTP